jgi:hypothetical protein
MPAHSIMHSAATTAAIGTLQPLSPYRQRWPPEKSGTQRRELGDPGAAGIPLR